LSFENCKNSNNVSATGSIAFKTAGGVSENASISNVDSNGNTAGSKVTFDYFATVAGTTRFIAAFYDASKNLVGVEISKKDDVTQGNNDNIEITLLADYDTAEKVEIFAWDNFDMITPLAEKNMYEY
jgi:hypothetical protein